MYLDDSSYAFESFKVAHTESILIADKNYRIVREEDSVSLKSSLMIGLVLVMMFLLISDWNSMIELWFCIDRFAKIFCLFAPSMFLEGAADGL